MSLLKKVRTGVVSRGEFLSFYFDALVDFI